MAGLLDDVFASTGFGGAGESFDSQVGGGANVDAAGASSGWATVIGKNYDPSWLSGGAADAFAAGNFDEVERLTGTPVAPELRSQGANISGSGTQGYANTIGGGSSGGTFASGGNLNPTVAQPYSGGENGFYQGGSGSSGSGGGGAGASSGYGTNSPSTPGYTIPNGTGGNSGFNIGNLLSLASGFANQSQPVVPGSSGGGVGSIPGVSIDNNQSGSSFGGLLGNNQQQQQQQVQQAPSQPIQDQVQESLGLFSLGGSKAAGNPLFQGGTHNVGSSGGSSFDPMNPTASAVAPMQAGHQQVQQSANSPQNVAEEGMGPIIGTGEQFGGSVDPVTGLPAPGATFGPMQGGNVSGGSQGAPMAASGPNAVEQPKEKIIKGPNGEKIKIKEKPKPKVDVNAIIKNTNAKQAGKEVEVNTAPAPSKQDKIKGEVQKDVEKMGLKGSMLDPNYTSDENQEVVGQKINTMVQSGINLTKRMVQGVGKDLGFTDQKQLDELEKTIQADRAEAKSKFKGTPEEFEKAWLGGEILTLMAGPNKKGALAKITPRAAKKWIGERAPRTARFLFGDAKFATNSVIANTAGQVAKSAGTGTAFGGLYGRYGVYAPDDATRNENTKTGATWGALMGGGSKVLPKVAPEVTGAALGAGISSYFGQGWVPGALFGSVAGNAARRWGIGRSKPTDSMIKQQIKDQSAARNTSTAKSNKASKYAEEKDIFMSPGEKNPTSTRIVDKEKGMTPGMKGKEEGTARVQERDQQIVQELRQVAKSVLPNGKSASEVGDLVSKMYKRIEHRQVSKAAVKDIKKDPDVQKALKKAKADEVSRSSSYKDGEMGKLIEADKYLTRRIKARTQSGEGIGNLKETQNKLRKIIKQDASSYDVARKLSHQSKTYKELSGEISKLKREPGQKAPTSDQVFRTIFKDSQAGAEVARKIKKAGGDYKGFTGLYRLTDQLQKSSLKKGLNKGTKMFTDFNVPQGAGVILSAVRKVFMFHRDNLTVRMLTDPKYTSRINKISNMPPKEQAYHTAKLLEDISKGDYAKYGIKKPEAAQISIMAAKAAPIYALNKEDVDKAKQVQTVDDINAAVKKKRETVKVAVNSPKAEPEVQKVEAKKVEPVKEMKAQYTVRREGDTLVISDGSKGVQKVAEGEQAERMLVNSAKRDAINVRAQKLISNISGSSKKGVIEAMSDPKIRAESIAIVREAHGPAAAYKFEQQLNKLGVGARSVDEAMSKKFGLDKEEQKSIQNQLPAKPNPKTANKADLEEYKKKLDEAYKKRFAQLQAQKKKSSRGFVRYHGQNQTTQKASGLRRELILLILSYLTKNPKVKGLLAAGGMQGDAARLAMRGLQSKL